MRAQTPMAQSDHCSSSARDPDAFGRAAYLMPMILALMAYAQAMIVLKRPPEPG
jgi:hypothetical protein